MWFYDSHPTLSWNFPPSGFFHSFQFPVFLCPSSNGGILEVFSFVLVSWYTAQTHNVLYFPHGSLLPHLSMVTIRIFFLSAKFILKDMLFESCVIVYKMLKFIGLKTNKQNFLCWQNGFLLQCWLGVRNYLCQWIIYSFLNIINSSKFKNS